MGNPKGVVIRTVSSGVYEKRSCSSLVMQVGQRRIWAAHQARRRARAVCLKGRYQENMMLKLFVAALIRQAGRCRPGAEWQVRVYAGVGEALHSVVDGSSLIRQARLRRTRSCAPSLRARRSKWSTSSSSSRRSCASTWPPWASAASTTWSAAPTCSRRVPAAASCGIAIH